MRATPGSVEWSQRKTLAQFIVRFVDQDRAIKPKSSNVEPWDSGRDPGECKFAYLLRAAQKEAELRRRALPKHERQVKKFKRRLKEEDEFKKVSESLTPIGLAKEELENPNVPAFNLEIDLGGGGWISANNNDCKPSKIKPLKHQFDIWEWLGNHMCQRAIHNLYTFIVTGLIKVHISYFVQCLATRGHTRDRTLSHMCR